MKHLLKSLCAITVAFAASAWMEANAQKVTFYTPRTVRIEKPQSGDESRNSLVVIAEPGKVKVKESVKDGAKVYRSSALTVTVKDGKVTFADNKGNIITSEGTWAFTPIEQGPDQGKFKVKQTFMVDADEGIYGVGLLQNGKMSQRGENRSMQQSNLEDYAHVFQSIKGYGIYWDNYSPTQFITPNEGVSGEMVLESQVGKGTTVTLVTKFSA